MNLILTIIKYGFYTTCWLCVATGFVLYKTKPNGLGVQFLSHFMIDDYVFFKIAKFDNKKYIGIFNRWKEL